MRGRSACGRRYLPQYFVKEADDIEDNEKTTQSDEEITEITAEQLAELVGGSVPEPNRITVGLTVKKSAELPDAAYDIAEFVNILREQTEETFTLDIRAGIGDENAIGGRKPPVVGFLADSGDEYEDDDDDEGGEDLRRTYRRLRGDIRS